MARPLQALIALARTDYEAALGRARHDPVAGNRAQLLAWVAHFAPPAVAGAIALESLGEAAKMDDAYWTVAICAWPLRALQERGLKKSSAARSARCCSARKSSRTR